jgi:hypothetical protein
MFSAGEHPRHKYYLSASNHLNQSAYKTQQSLHFPDPLCLLMEVCINHVINIPFTSAPHFTISTYYLARIMLKRVVLHAFMPRRSSRIAAEQAHDFMTQLAGNTLFCCSSDLTQVTHSSIQHTQHTPHTHTHTDIYILHSVFPFLYFRYIYSYSATAACSLHDLPHVFQIT